MKSLFFLALISTLSTGYSDEIPKDKLDLIEKAISVMNLKAQMQGLIENMAEVKVKRMQNNNPGLPDSTAAEAKTIMEGVYAANLEKGLYPQLYKVFDKYLSKDDLQFAVNFHTSDAGQRFSKVAPQIIQEGMALEKTWSDHLQPRIDEKLRDRFKGLHLKIEGN